MVADYNDRAILYVDARHRNYLLLSTVDNKESRSMTDATSTKPRRGRPRLPTPERLENKKATQRAWVLRNHAYVTAQSSALGSRPEYRERRRELHNLKRQALLETGFVPHPRGRPRLYDEDEARARQLINTREATPRPRARRRAPDGATPGMT